MTATLAPARPAAAARATFAGLAAREIRRFAVNPVFLLGVGMTAWLTSTGPGASVTEIDSVNVFPAGFLGGFGMMAAFWLTRSMRASEPVVGVAPTTLPARTAALGTVAVVPFLCGVLSLFAFLHFYPLGSRRTGRSARQRGSPSSSGRSSSRRSAARCWVSRWAAGPASPAPRSCCSWSCTAG